MNSRVKSKQCVNYSVFIIKPKCQIKISSGKQNNKGMLKPSKWCMLDFCFVLFCFALHSNLKKLLLNT